MKQEEMYVGTSACKLLFLVDESGLGLTAGVLSIFH